MKHLLVSAAVLATGLAPGVFEPPQQLGLPLLNIATTPLTQLGLAPQRQEAYLNEQYGFRLVYPEGYQIETSSHFLDAEPSLLQRVEIWPPGTYDPARQFDQGNLENSRPWPVHITLTVYDNHEAKPLTDWVPSEAGPLTEVIVGDQPALSYRSVGTYEYDNRWVANPDHRYVLHLQVGYTHSASPHRQVFERLVESLVFDDLTAEGSLESIQYKRLAMLLAAQDWQGADLETRTILQRLVGSYPYAYPRYSDLDNIFAAVACEDLRRIDDLWMDASDGQFGFTAQATLWQEQRTDVALTHTVEAFAEAVDWQRSSPPPEDWQTIISNSPWRLDQELTYTLDAPAGHLPWMGVSSLLLEHMWQASGASCGSCTIDVWYMSGDRFGDYLIDFFDRLDACPAESTQPR